MLHPEPLEAVVRTRAHWGRIGANLANGKWTIQATADGTPVTYEAKALVAADGAHSQVIQTLGIDVPQRYRH